MKTNTDTNPSSETPLPGRPPIALVLGSDDKYALYLTVAVTSALKHLDNSLQVAVYVLDGGISPKNIDLLKKNVFKVRPDADLVISPIDSAALSGLSAGRDLGRDLLPDAAYLRLLVSKIVATEITTALYLDSDVLVTEDVSPLFDLNLSNFPCGAVRDRFGAREMNRLREDFAFPGPNSDYFNSGVLLINLPVWRSQGVSERVLEVLKNHRESIRFHDQDALNVAMAGNWISLPQKWNHQIHGPSLQFPGTPPRGKLGILHFISRVKPWYGNRQCLHEDLYLRAMFSLDWLPFHKKAGTLLRFVRKGLLIDYKVLRSSFFGPQ